MTPEQQFQKRYYDALVASQYWPVERLAAHQRGELELLLRHARATAPFYADRLDPVFAGDGSIAWEGWLEIPILTRDEFRRAAPQMVSTAPIAAHGKTGEFTTSGSTGMPITVTITRLLNLVSRCASWRAHRWHGIDWSRDLVLRGPDIEGKTPGDAVRTWGLPGDESSTGIQYHAPRAMRPEETLDLALAVRPGYLGCGPKFAVVLAELAMRRGVELKLDAILAYGEAVTDYDRELAKAAFGARIYELYSSKEAGHMAHPCPAGHGFHVAAENVFVEIVDDDGMPAAAGEEGRVVVTPFSSTGQPLIRYDQGDRAVAGAQCSCGRTLPLIERIAGRVSAVFRHPDGRSMARVMPPDYLPILGALQWQVVQTGPTSFEVRYTPKDWGMPPDLPRFIETFRGHFFEDAQVTLIKMDQLPLTATGKLVEYINRWDHTAAGGERT